MDRKETEVLEKRRVAKPAAFVLLSVMFKRYSAAGISSILLLFLNLKLGYDKDASTTIYHAFECLSCFFAIIGAIIADSWLGVYKTIVLMSMVFSFGCFIIAIGVIDILYLPLQAFTIVGLVVITVGEGCLKPLSRTYGAYQYKSTEASSIALFFVLYYFMYNCGSITSRFINPILRQDVKCFGNNDCFALAFGIPGILVILVALLIMVANRYSQTNQVKATTLLKLFVCIRHAIVMKITSRKSRLIYKDDHHWLDYSEEKYGKTMISDIRIIFRVIILYLPITLFWALFYQQGSRWIFQAVRMNGDLGFYTIKSDQLNVMNPFLVLLMIPMCEYVLYPILSIVGIRSDLQKVTLGGILAGLAFLISAAVEMQIENHKYLEVHMAWMIPQYSVMALGEVLTTIPMMNFSYSIAPSSMKTMLQAFSNLSEGLGNLIVVVVVGSKLMDSQFFEFILFAGLMFLDMIVFGFLASRFKPLKEKRDESIELINQNVK